ncbi:MAG: GTP-binding protein [Candidatus Cloacimonetes bacterium]|nr:GTP-binding protein [Candidatus Cloacimonadota bacterium]
MDFDPEETAKKMSLGLSIGYANYNDHKINILDAPGYPDFVGDPIVAMPAVENVVIVANAAGGFEVGLELALEQLEDKKKGKIVRVNRMDNEHADYDKTLEGIHENTGINPVKIHIPIGKEGSFEGVVDIIRQKAIKAGVESDVPANMTDAVEEARMQLMEAVAETSEDLLNEFLENHGTS